MLTGLSPNRDDGGVKLVGEGRDAGAAGLDPGLESVELARIGEGRPYRDPRRASAVGLSSLPAGVWAKASGDGHDGSVPAGAEAAKRADEDAATAARDDAAQLA